MKRSNYIVKLNMCQDEIACFRNMRHLVSLSMSVSESNLISRLLGYKDVRELTLVGYKHNPFLRDAFQVLSFLYVAREESDTFNHFWQRLLFTDKEVEAKVRRTFNISDDEEALSVMQLELMWLLDSKTDKLDTPDSANE